MLIQTHQDLNALPRNPGLPKLPAHPDPDLRPGNAEPEGAQATSTTDGPLATNSGIATPTGATDDDATNTTGAKEDQSGSPQVPKRTRAGHQIHEAKLANISGGLDNVVQITREGNEHCLRLGEDVLMLPCEHTFSSKGVSPEEFEDLKAKQLSHIKLIEATLEAERQSEVIDLEAKAKKGQAEVIDLEPKAKRHRIARKSSDTMPVVGTYWYVLGNSVKLSQDAVILRADDGTYQSSCSNAVGVEETSELPDIKKMRVEAYNCDDTVKVDSEDGVSMRRLFAVASAPETPKGDDEELNKIQLGQI